MSRRCQVCGGVIKIMIRLGERTCCGICEKNDDTTTRRATESGNGDNPEELEHV